MKFSQRLVLVFLPLVLVSLIVVGAFAFLTANRMIEDSLETHLTAISYTKFSAFERWIRDIKVITESIAQRPLVITYTEVIVSTDPSSGVYQSVSEALVRDHLIPNLTAVGGITDYMILDPADGKIVASSNETMIGKFRENEDFFLEGKVATYASQIHYSPADEGTVLHVSTPIHNSSGELVAVLVGHVDLEELSRIMSDDPYRLDTQETYLISDAHLYITHPKNVGWIHPQQTLFSEGINQCVAGNSGFREYADYAGVPVYGSYLWSEEWNFCILTEVDRSLAHQPITELRNLVLASSVGISILGVILSVWFARLSTKPVDTLLSGVQQIGQGNLEYRLPSAKGLEFNQLTQAINEMANNLLMSRELNERMFAEVQQSRDTLEIQVQERTQDLQEAQRATLNMLVDLEDAQIDLEKQAKDLKRSNEELESFAYIASHDLQEPLRMVASYLQLIERRYADKLDDAGHEFIHYAVDGAARMKNLINDLLAYSRVGTKGRPFEEVSLNSVVGRVCANLQRTIDEQKAVITVGDLPEIMADERQMVQVFQNLVGNGIKFHGEETPMIHIDAKQVANPRNNRDWVRITVQDNGIGIEEQYFERIFVIFQRLHTTTEYEGTGIGLAICKKIIERHGGEISVESEPGKGTKFICLLPIQHDEEK